MWLSPSCLRRLGPRGFPLVFAFRRSDGQGRPRRPADARRVGKRWIRGVILSVQVGGSIMLNSSKNGRLPTCLQRAIPILKAVGNTCTRDWTQNCKPCRMPGALGSLLPGREDAYRGRQIAGLAIGFGFRTRGPRPRFVASASRWQRSGNACVHSPVPVRVHYRSFSITEPIGERYRCCCTCSCAWWIARTSVHLLLGMGVERNDFAEFRSHTIRRLPQALPGSDSGLCGFRRSCLCGYRLGFLGNLQSNRSCNMA